MAAQAWRIAGSVVVSMGAKLLIEDDEIDGPILQGLFHLASVLRGGDTEVVLGEKTAKERSREEPELQRYEEHAEPEEPSPSNSHHSTSQVVTAAV